MVSVPVTPDELAARCQALLRRPRNVHTRWDPMAASLINIGPLTVDVGRKEIRSTTTTCPSPASSSHCSSNCAVTPPRYVLAPQLLEEVWGPNWVGDTHVVDVHLSNLRRKLQKLAPELRFIHTVRGVGFRLSTDLLRSEIDDRENRKLVSA